MQRCNFSIFENNSLENQITSCFGHQANFFDLELFYLRGHTKKIFLQVIKFAPLSSFLFVHYLSFGKSHNLVNGT